MKKEREGLALVDNYLKETPTSDDQDIVPVSPSQGFEQIAQALRDVSAKLDATLPICESLPSEGYVCSGCPAEGGDYCIIQEIRDILSRHRIKPSGQEGGLMPGLTSLCAVDRDYIRVIERALKAASITPTLTPDSDRPTHYIVHVAEEDVDRATAALRQYGTFVPPEEA